MGAFDITPVLELMVKKTALIYFLVQVLLLISILRVNSSLLIAKY